jgi:hypothetical protein
VDHASEPWSRNHAACQSATTDITRISTKCLQESSANRENLCGGGAAGAREARIQQTVNGFWKSVYREILHDLTRLPIGIEPQLKKLAVPIHRDKGALARHRGVI